jgi:hypothetical protein
VAPVAHDMGIGDGSVMNHCKWVVREAGPLFLGWPDEQWQSVISDHIKKKLGLPLCIGSGNGSQVGQLKEPHL